MPDLAWPQDVVLERNNIRLTPLALQHEEGLAAAAADGELWTLTYTSVPAPGETRSYIETAIASRAAGQRLAFAVIDLQTDTLVGSTSYHDIVPSIKRVEIGYTWYARRAQRTHVNTTCKLLLMQHAFETLDCPVVGWRTDILNHTSQAAIAKLGAHKDGVIRHHTPRRDGSVRDTVMFSMLRSEWPQHRARLEARLASHSFGATT